MWREMCNSGVVSMTFVGVLLLVFALLACPDRGVPLVYAMPSQMVQLQTAVPNATWTLIEAGGGTLSDVGVYVAPPCGVGVPGVYHAKASNGGQEQTIEIRVNERTVKVEIVCATRVGSILCEPIPAAGIEVAPGEQLQFYARTTFTCHEEWSPTRPIGF